MPHSVFGRALNLARFQHQRTQSAYTSARLFACMCVEFLESLSGCVSNYPSYDNYVMTASALLRLQDVYDLETTSIASGMVGSTATSSPAMSGNDSGFFNNCNSAI